MKLFEAPLKDLAFWQTAEDEETGEKPILVCVMRHYPRWIGSKQFDIFAPELGPPAHLLKRFKELQRKHRAIAKGMRSWGSTLEQKIRNGNYKAFTDTFGPSGSILRRHWRNDLKAKGTLAVIRSHLAQDETVVLFCHEEKPPCHRYILMHMIRRDRTLRRMFEVLGYSKEYLEFANRVEGRFSRLPMREI